VKSQLGEHPIVLFDGVCNFCNGAVIFIADRDRDARFRFASLQSPIAAELLEARGVELPPGDPDTLMLIEGGKVYDRSDAALRIARHLRVPVSFAAAFMVVPRSVRDAAYRFIAKNRYRWFGRSEQCRIPTPELRARFLS
jgi:predicted DCC family thiol-disulfide oxidoreductase YuxK